MDTPEKQEAPQADRDYQEVTFLKLVKRGYQKQQREGRHAAVEPSGFAWQAGLRQGCRLVEVCEFVIEDIRCFVLITIYVEVFF